jgi:sugar/nucleoside kinase (ribokinase family)
MKTQDVVGVCNALVDILIEADDADLRLFNLNKGVMHLVEADQQNTLLEYFRAKPHQVELGGSAMNAIRTLASLGKRTVFAGMVSNDDFGERIKRRMAELGIKAHLGTSHEGTGSCVILITPDGERTMNTHLGSSRLYDASHIPHDDIKTAQVLHFCGYQWDTDGQKAGIKMAIDTAVQSETLISFDVADPFVVSRYRDDFVALIDEHADIVFSNKEEAKLLFGTPDIAAERIAAAGAVAVIKLGADGALIRRGDDVYNIAPVSTRVVDTTAAGDMFAAGFLYGFTSGRTLDVCGKMAATIASDVISRVGAVVSEEGLKRLKNL